LIKKNKINNYKQTIKKTPKNLISINKKWEVFFSEIDIGGTDHFMMIIAVEK
jgi:hypothetical protein